VTDPERSSARSPWRWSDPFKVRSVWIPPVILVAILIVVMTLVYFGSVVNPTGHLRGLPVAVVNQDVGASVDGHRVDFGRQLAAGLISSPAVSSRLALHASTSAAAKDRMGIGQEYAAAVIPPKFTASLVAVAGVADRRRNRRSSC
jgi:YhgE/Pip-like protein